MFRKPSGRQFGMAETCALRVMKAFSIIRFLLLLPLGFAFAPITFKPIIREWSHAQFVDRRGDYAEGELLVKVQPGASPKFSALEEIGPKRFERIGSKRYWSPSGLSWQRLHLPRGMSMAEGISAYHNL